MTCLSASLVCKIFTVILLLCLTEASGGTCLSYGHSCWGGHGKRNGFPQWIAGTPQKKTSSWFVSKVFNPTVEKPLGGLENSNGFQIQNDDDYNDLEETQKIKYEVFPVSDWTDIYSRNDAKASDVDTKFQSRQNDAKDSDEDVVFLAPGVKQRSPMSKYRILQIMERAGDKPKSEH